MLLFDDSYPEVLNETLQTYYDSTCEGYRQDSASYEGDSYDELNTPYDSLIFQYISYVGEDYVSLVYNSVTYIPILHGTVLPLIAVRERLSLWIAFLMTPRKRSESS